MSAKGTVFSWSAASRLQGALAGPPARPDVRLKFAPAIEAALARRYCGDRGELLRVLVDGGLCELDDVVNTGPKPRYLPPLQQP